jgi:hypothetical protein
MFRCSHTIIRERITCACCAVTLESTSNALPDDGVTAPKDVGAILMSILMQI